jgi:membrane protein YdbS with pleckstrin-like domain
MCKGLLLIITVILLLFVVPANFVIAGAVLFFIYAFFNGLLPDGIMAITVCITIGAVGFLVFVGIIHLISRFLGWDKTSDE